MNDLTVSADVGGNRIATLQVQAASAKILDTLGDAGQYIYSRRWQVYDEQDPPELIEWPDLTSAQQLNVLYQELIYAMKEMAKSYYTNAARDTAGDTATTEADTRYDI